MEATTVKLSAETSERIRSLGGSTFEETIVEALDSLEATRFWTQAEAAFEWQNSLSESDRAHRAAVDSDVDQAFDGIE